MRILVFMPLLVLSACGLAHPSPEQKADKAAYLGACIPEMTSNLAHQPNAASLAKQSCICAYDTTIEFQRRTGKGTLIELMRRECNSAIPEIRDALKAEEEELARLAEAARVARIKECGKEYALRFAFAGEVETQTASGECVFEQSDMEDLYQEFLGTGGTLVEDCKNWCGVPLDHFRKGWIVDYAAAAAKGMGAAAALRSKIRDVANEELTKQEASDKAAEIDAELYKDCSYADDAVKPCPRRSFGNYSLDIPSDNNVEEFEEVLPIKVTYKNRDAVARNRLHFMTRCLPTITAPDEFKQAACNCIYETALDSSGETLDLAGARLKANQFIGYAISGCQNDLNNEPKTFNTRWAIK